MAKTRKILLTLVIVGAAGALASVGVFSAFSSTTTNSGNDFAAGTVTIGDNDGGTAAYNVTNGKPGSTQERCIKVTYSGSLPSTVTLYRSAFTGGTGLDGFVDVAVTKGTGDQANCSDFSGSTSVYSGELGAFPSSYGSGLSLTNGSGNAAWSQNDAVTFRVRATLQDDNGAQGLTAGTHSFTWEARNN
jgi:predicted ribosomally synthesized peptide with SipW-like signal peptide